VRLIVHVVPRKLIENLRLDLHGARVERDTLLREADLAEGGSLSGAICQSRRSGSRRSSRATATRRPS